MSVKQLQQSLPLDSAQLSISDVDGHKLWLLDTPAETALMSPQAIGRFWQHFPYWAFAWAGGRALAQFIGEHPEYVEGKQVLDFGCGSGLVGIAAAKAGASDVWIADLDPVALQAAQINADLNECVLHSVDDKRWEADVLLASDVLYDLNSNADLGQLMSTIPGWLLAEPLQIVPDCFSLKRLKQLRQSTLPAVGDFDREVVLGIYERE